jgi:hypothetical protein
MIIFIFSYSLTSLPFWALNRIRPNIKFLERLIHQAAKLNERCDEIDNAVSEGIMRLLLFKILSVFAQIRKTCVIFCFCFFFLQEEEDFADSHDDNDHVAASGLVHARADHYLNTMEDMQYKIGVTLINQIANEFGIKIAILGKQQKQRPSNKSSSSSVLASSLSSSSGSKLQTPSRPLYKPRAPQTSSSAPPPPPRLTRTVINHSNTPPPKQQVSVQIQSLPQKPPAVRKVQTSTLSNAKQSHDNKGMVRVNQLGRLLVQNPPASTQVISRNFSTSSNSSIRANGNGTTKKITISRLTPASASSGSSNNNGSNNNSRAIKVSVNASGNRVIQPQAKKPRAGGTFQQAIASLNRQ